VVYIVSECSNLPFAIVRPIKDQKVGETETTLKMKTTVKGFLSQRNDLPLNKALSNKAIPAMIRRT